VSVEHGAWQVCPAVLHGVPRGAVRCAVRFTWNIALSSPDAEAAGRHRPCSPRSLSQQLCGRRHVQTLGQVPPRPGGTHLRLRAPQSARAPRLDWRGGEHPRATCTVGRGHVQSAVSPQAGRWSGAGLNAMPPARVFHVKHPRQSDARVLRQPEPRW